MEKMKSIIAWTVVVLWAGLVTNSALAATFTTGTFNNSTQKFIIMDGAVEEGDLDRLKSAWITQGVPAVGATLFLNSPGGSGLEMKKVSKFVEEQKMRTFVLSGRDCFSACAVIWAHGATRMMETGAKIGFHVGSIAITEQGVNWFEQVLTGWGWSGVQDAVQSRIGEDMQFFHSMNVPHKDAFVAKIAMFGSAGSKFWMVESDQDLAIVGGRRWK